MVQLSVVYMLSSRKAYQDMQAPKSEHARISLGYLWNPGTSEHCCLCVVVSKPALLSGLHCSPSKSECVRLGYILGSNVGASCRSSKCGCPAIWDSYPSLRPPATSSWATYERMKEQCYVVRLWSVHITWVDSTSATSKSSVLRTVDKSSCDTASPWKCLNLIL